MNDYLIWCMQRGLLAEVYPSHKSNCMMRCAFLAADPLPTTGVFKLETRESV